MSNVFHNVSLVVLVLLSKSSLEIFVKKKVAYEKSP